MKLNVGCGNKIIDGYLGVDKFECSGARYICDIEKENLPFDNNVVDSILLDNVIEHFLDIPGVMRELIRVSRKGADIQIITPHFSSLDSWMDPTHLHHLSFFSFDHFESDDVSHYVGKGLRVKKKRLSFSGGVFGILGRLIFYISPKAYERKFCFMFRASTLYIELEVL